MSEAGASLIDEKLDLKVVPKTKVNISIDITDFVRGYVKFCTDEGPIYLFKSGVLGCSTS
jgi:hypothetical protein